MKQKISITRNENEIFNGKVAGVAIKQEYIIKKSIELFDDEDPCIIHQSYVVKEYVDILLNVLQLNDEKIINVQDHIKELDFLDYSNLQELKINLL